MAGIASDITGAGEAIEGVSSIAKTVEDTLFKIWPGLDKEGVANAARELEEKLMDQQAAMNAGQSEVNKVEAASPQLFVAGWRPFIGWVCGAGFAWAFVIGPIVAMIVRVWNAAYALPVLDTGSLTALTLGMLGLAGARTYEKIQGIEPPSTPITTTKVVHRGPPAK